MSDYCIFDRLFYAVHLPTLSSNSNPPYSTNCGRIARQSYETLLLNWQPWMFGWIHAFARRPRWLLFLLLLRRRRLSSSIRRRMREVLLFFFFIAVRCCSLFLSSSVLVGGVRVGEAGGKRGRTSKWKKREKEAKEEKEEE
jgi:hypothetical protein